MQFRPPIPSRGTAPGGQKMAPRPNSQHHNRLPAVFLAPEAPNGFPAVFLGPPSQTSSPKQPSWGSDAIPATDSQPRNCIRGPNFLAASAAARATRPEPEDFTKRQWERAIGLWRLRMRASGSRSEGGIECAPLAAGPGSFYHLIRMFSEADAQRVT